VAIWIHDNHEQNTDKYLTTQVTQILYVDVNRTDNYIENGSITKPFKTIQAAIIAASGNTLLDVSPGEYVGDINLGTTVTVLRGSGINATFLAGNVIAGDRAHSLQELRIKNTGSLTVTDNLFARNLHLQCAVTVNGGFLDGHNIYLAPDSDIVPLTVITGGGVMGNEISIVAQGNINAINQSAGTIVLFHGYVTNNSLAAVTIDSNGGVCGLIDMSVGNTGFGAAISMDNDGAALQANTLSGIVCSGNISCGAAHTYVEGLNFVGFGALTGTNLIYKPASRLNNDSSVAGSAVKDALETLDTNKLAKNAINGSFATVDSKTITVVDGQITSIV
jgi:hypothetical protein